MAPRLEWTPTVRPTYTRSEPLPPDAARQAILRGIDWHTKARMLIDASWKEKYNEYRRQEIVNADNPVGPAPEAEWAAGDGRFGVLEGVSSRIHQDGSQPIRWWLRSDSNGETALAFALRAKLDGDTRSRRVAANLLDWVYFGSGLYDKTGYEPLLERTRSAIRMMMEPVGPYPRQQNRPPLGEDPRGDADGGAGPAAVIEAGPARGIGRAGDVGLLVMNIVRRGRAKRAAQDTLKSRRIECS